VVSFTHRPPYPQGKSPGTHRIGGWVSPKAVLDAVVKKLNNKLKKKLSQIYLQLSV